MKTCCKASSCLSVGDFGGWTLVVRLLLVCQLET